MTALLVRVCALGDLIDGASQLLQGQVGEDIADTQEFEIHTRSTHTAG